MVFKVVEAFSGIGSQAKALSNLGVDYEVVHTIEWDINAIYAYDIIHNGPQVSSKFLELNKEDLVKKLSKYQLSRDGKKPLDVPSLKRMSEETLRRIYRAIVRTRNLVSITDVKAKDLPEDIDLLTYSFPCQDLSISGFWHGNKSGIDRGANNRSSMLWEVERILMEFVETEKSLPKYLIMENVTNIRSKRHKDNFKEWTDYLESIGYVNGIYDLKATNFGIPQNRKRTFMLSVYCENESMKEMVDKFLDNNNLEDVNKELQNLEGFLRLDYANEIYMKEATNVTPNNTVSRRRIKVDNPMIVNDNGVITRDIVRTITTKQDRHPNSGVIYHDDILQQTLLGKNKSDFRYLTPRECFLLMGFKEKDFQRLIDENFEIRKNGDFLTVDKLTKMAGNSIVVNVIQGVIEQVFKIEELKRNLSDY